MHAEPAHSAQCMSHRCKQIMRNVHIILCVTRGVAAPYLAHPTSSCCTFTSGTVTACCRLQGSMVRPDEASQAHSAHTVHEPSLQANHAQCAHHPVHPCTRHVSRGVAYPLAHASCTSHLIFLYVRLLYAHKAKSLLAVHCKVHHQHGRCQV